MIELKAVEGRNAQLLFEAWGQHAPNFTRLTARVFADVSDAERYIAALFANPRSFAFHIIEPNGSVVGLVKALVTEHRAQIGYVVHEPYWGRGFATEAVRHVVALLEGMPDISRIWATCALDNPASYRVLEKCGFEREAVLRRWVTYPALGGSAVDNYSYVRPSW